MSKLNLDMKTAKKIISSYAEKILIYMKENKELKTQLSDMKTCLEINKSMLYNNVFTHVPKEKSQIVEDLQKENGRLMSIIEKLQKDKSELETKLQTLGEKVSEGTNIMKEQLKMSKEEVFILKNNIEEKHNIIYLLKKELQKYYNQDYTTQKELLIGDPTIINTEINNELCETRELMNKYSFLLHNEKKKNALLEGKIKSLRTYLEDQKKSKKIAKKFEDIEMLGYILTSDENLSDGAKTFDKDDNLESPIVQFPPKITHKNSLMTHLNNSVAGVLNESITSVTNIPKLNLKTVISKYKPLKKSEIVEKAYKVDNFGNEDYIEKLKYQKAFYKTKAMNYKKKIKELKKILEIFKNHCKSVSTLSSMNNSSISSLKQLSNSQKSTTTDDNKNILKNIERNDSMCQSVTVLIEDEFEKEEALKNQEDCNNTIISNIIDQNDNNEVEKYNEILFENQI